MAAPSTGEFAGRSAVHVGELVDAAWIATPSSNSGSLLGVRPACPDGRASSVPRVTG
ncbi:hypothetical protein AB0F36_36130 [Streptomyces sp. NPDC029080]|uniref:hypothetical protein n=1 Tax=Streptomyces sp. NPDC029080 TaxID=3155017 RepID=UPI0033CF95A6